MTDNKIRSPSDDVACPQLDHGARGLGKPSLSLLEPRFWKTVEAAGDQFIGGHGCQLLLGLRSVTPVRRWRMESLRVGSSTG